MGSFEEAAFERRPLQALQKGIYESKHLKYNGYMHFGDLGGQPRENISTKTILNFIFRMI